jgi:hypothetical protein
MIYGMPIRKVLLKQDQSVWIVVGSGRLVAVTMVCALLLIGPAAEKDYILSSELVFCYKSEGLKSHHLGFRRLWNFSNFEKTR